MQWHVVIAEVVGEVEPTNSDLPTQLERDTNALLLIRNNLNDADEDRQARVFEIRDRVKAFFNRVV